ncbi:hypothetical protein SLE2022_192210 [Rubroshorea leprosula]
MESMMVKSEQKQGIRRMCMNQQQNDQTNAVTTVKRSSRFRGVSKHRWTCRYEAHLWDKISWNVTQKKKGKEGAYDDEEAAARAYDLAALKYWGTSTYTNFPASLRIKSSGLSREVSKYRGVARHHHNGRWEARIGRDFGSKYLYVGTYNEYTHILIKLSTQEEAARAYDIAASEYRGINAMINFDLSIYMRWLKPRANNNAVAAAAKESLSAVTEAKFIPLLNTYMTSKEDAKPSLFYHSNSFPTDFLSSPPKQLLGAMMKLQERELSFIL